MKRTTFKAGKRDADGMASNLSRPLGILGRNGLVDWHTLAGVITGMKVANAAGNILEDVSGTKWFVEYRDENDWHFYAIDRVLLETESKHQFIQVLQTKEYGLCLVLDGRARVFETDEFVYHEVLIHPSLVVLRGRLKVFLAGDGDGGGVREILRHNTVEQLTWVDIDEKVVEVSKRYLSGMHGDVMTDKRLRSICVDAREYLGSSSETFDCIVVSVTEPLKGNPSLPLYTKEFYEIAKRRLSSGGLLITQAGSVSLEQIENFASTVLTLRQVFASVEPYQVSLPSFGAPWGFVIASDSQSVATLTADEINRRLQGRGCDGLEFYDGEVHQALFILPRFARKAIDDNIGRVIMDSNPLVVRKTVG